MNRKTWMVLLLLFCSAAAVSAQTSSRPFTPEDMLSIVTFMRGSGPIISPTGHEVAYATVDVSQEANIRAFWPTGFLWVVSTEGGQPRRLSEDHADTPRWSPDGRSLAFLRTHQGQTQLVLWDSASGRLRQVGPPLERDHLRFFRPSPQWMADGRTLILPVLEPSPPAEEPSIYVLRSTDPIVPGDARFTDTRLWKLMAVDAESGQARSLTTKPLALRGLHVSPDGAHLLYRAVKPDTLGRFRAEVIDSWVLSVKGEGAPQLALPGRRPNWTVFSPDGHDVLFPDGTTLRAKPLGGTQDRVVIERFPKRTRQPVVAPASGRLALLAARPGTGPQDSRMYSIERPTFDVIVVNLATKAIKRLTPKSQSLDVSDLVWSRDGRVLFYRTTDSSSFRESVYRWDIGDEKAVPILSADEALDHVSVAADGSMIAFTAMSATHPADGYVIEVAKQQQRQITELNPQLASFHFVAPQVFDYFSADGDPLRALLFKPEGASAERPVPVVTYVYEKLSPLKNRFNAEAQLHVSHGYAYLMPDVLVKVGYTGDSFVKSVVPAVNAVRAMGFTTGKFGITGGSFGGYAGLFLISHVDIFAAAVLRAPPSEFFSTWGDGRDRDIWTIETGQARTGGSPWEVPERYMANSPFFQADRVKTPVLILHGKEDFTVPFQQGEMMFHALRALGKTARLVVYRDGDHSLVRGSRRSFLDVYRRKLTWWKQYLRGE